ncbi:MAG: hypothetical protein NC206_06450 [Bacteroides sp.]|nr:hypothetical protein [Roseburia sp.]MCM1346709.1 hypothetical protein [Bacteroides sp.]MCM1421466.1 hypothetical protein [Bacteroides sp.]
MIDVSELIKGNIKLDSDTLVELKELVDKYPFFQTARLLYITNLFALRSENFTAEMKKGSVFITDRRTLFSIIEGKNYDIEYDYESMPNRIETEGDENRTISLIDNFLLAQKEESAGKSVRVSPSIADLTTDYTSFLMQQEGDTPQEDESKPKLKGEELIDSFIEETKGKQRFEMADLDAEFKSPEISDEDEEIYTENMVNIYIRQGRYEQALEILRKICLTNPKKTINFATQIKLLEVITESKKKSQIKES